MRAPDEFRQNAKDCITLARRTSNPESKALLLELAQTWIRLADRAAEIEDHTAERRNATLIRPEQREQPN